MTEVTTQNVQLAVDARRAGETQSETLPGWIRDVLASEEGPVLTVQTDVDEMDESDKKRIAVAALVLLLLAILWGAS